VIGEGQFNRMKGKNIRSQSPIKSKSVFRGVLKSRGETYGTRVVEWWVDASLQSVKGPLRPKKDGDGLI